MQLSARFTAGAFFLVLVLEPLALSAPPGEERPGAAPAAAPAGEQPASAARYWQPRATVPRLSCTSMDPKPFDPFLDALTGGKPWLKLRFRAESVDQDGITKRGNAFTVRSVVGYETLPYYGVTATVEFENVSNVGGKAYNDTINGKNRPVIADPTTTEVNRAFLRRDITDGAAVKAGRQRIILDNARFVGNVGWRQNEQTFDAIVLTGEPNEDIDLFYGYVNNVNRIFGDDSPNGDARMDSHLFNASSQLGDAGKLTGYWYYLDYERINTPQFSTSTVGVRFTGNQPMDGDNKVLYAFDLAHQEDVGGNPNSVSARYYSAEVGLGLGAITIKAGREELEGSANDPTDVFTTPLATLHAFNGWADKFLNTPGAGLEDTWIAVEGRIDENNKVAGVLHEFGAEAGGADYGRELDLLYTHKVSDRVSWGAKAAYYNEDGFATDTEKVWLWLTLSS